MASSASENRESMTDLAPKEFDATGWVRRWDRQQAGYVPDREESFALMLEILQRLGAAPGRLLDLGCGPGSLSDRVLARFPDAEVIGLDLDPVMLELGRRTLGERVQWVQADLRTPDWPDAVPGGPVDAVVSAIALHWLDTEHLPALAGGIAAVLRRDGVFVNFDTLLADPAAPRLAALTKDLRVAQTDSTTCAVGFEDFSAWWDSLAEEPELRELFAERDRRFGPRRHGCGTTLAQWQQALPAAGFTEVATLIQVMDHRLLVAIH